MDIVIRPYIPSDYEILKNYYQNNGWYDKETDAQTRIDSQVSFEPKSVLLAFEDDRLVGTVSLLFTGRHGIYFRLIADSIEIRKRLMKAGEPVFQSHGYNEIHILAPENDSERKIEYESNGFTSGSSYRWFWKRL